MKAFCGQNNISIIHIDEWKKLWEWIRYSKIGGERKAKKLRPNLYYTIKYFGESSLTLEYALNFANESKSTLMLTKSKLIFKTSTRINVWWLLMQIVPNLKEKYTTPISINIHRKLILVKVLKINFDFVNIKVDLLSFAKFRAYSRVKEDSPKYLIV